MYIHNFGLYAYNCICTNIILFILLIPNCTDLRAALYMNNSNQSKNSMFVRLCHKVVY